MAWGTAAASVFPDRPDLATYLESRLTALGGAGTLDESSLLRVVDEATEPLAEHDAQAAGDLRKRLQRHVYEFLLAVDATSDTEAEPQPTAVTEPEDDVAIVPQPQPDQVPSGARAEPVVPRVPAPEAPAESDAAPSSGYEDRPDWTSPEFWGEFAPPPAPGPPRGMPDLPFIAPRSGFHLTDPSEVHQPRPGETKPGRHGGNFTEAQSVPPGSSGYGGHDPAGRQGRSAPPPPLEADDPAPPLPEVRGSAPRQARSPRHPGGPAPHPPSPPQSRDQASGGGGPRPPATGPPLPPSDRYVPQRTDPGAPPTQYGSGPGAGAGDPSGAPSWPSDWGGQAPPSQPAAPPPQQRGGPPQDPDGYGAAIELTPEDFEDTPVADLNADLSQQRRQIDELLRRKRCDQAAGLLQQLAQETGGHEVAEIALDAGDRSRALGKKMAATNCYLAATRADPLYDVPLQRLADLCIDDRDIDTAVSYLERVAWICRRRGDGRGALRVYRRIVTIAPYREDILEKLMRAQQTGRLD